MNNLTERREAAGLTRSKLAAMVGVSYDTVRAWETGASRPPQWRLQLLYKLLGCSPGELGIEGHKTNPHIMQPKQNDGITPRDPAEIEPLLAEIKELDCMREVAAYLGADSERKTANRIRAGMVTEKEIDIIKRVIAHNRTGCGVWE